MKINRLSIVLMRLLMLVALISLSACSGSGSEGGISGSGGPPKITVQGYAEKGPFLRRSEVTYRYVDLAGGTVSENFSTETTDDLGSFELELEEAGLVSIRVNGYQFNEVTGQVSDGNLSLRGLYLSSDEAQQNAQVNLLTHIIYDRVIAIAESGATSAGLALTQAEVELLNELETVMPDISINDFSQLSIYNRINTTSQGNAYLLLFSAALYQHAINTTPSGSSVSGQMTLILNALSDDFVDGDLEASSDILNGLVLAIQQLDPDQVITNLENRSRGVLGLTLNVPDFSSFIGQFLITYPPENANLSAVTPVRLSVPSGMRNVSLDLIIDGVVAETITEPPYEFSWDPYFWTSSEDENKRHSILIRAYNSFGAEIVSNLVNVNVLASSRNQIELTAPEPDAAIENSDAVTLQWTAYAGAAQYRIQVSNTSEFTSLLYNETTTGTSLDIDNMTAGSYFWRIQLTDANANTGTWSNTMQFSINGPLPPANISSSWEAGSSNYDVTISWENSEYSSSVEYEIAHDANFNRRVATGTSSSNSLLQNLEIGNYFIRMRSFNSSGVRGDWSAVTTVSSGLFQTRLGGSGDDSVSKIIASSQGGYIVLAQTRSPEIASRLGAQWSDYESWVIKLDEQGRVEWEHLSMMTGAHKHYSSFTELSDGSIVLVGRATGSNLASAVKLDENGDVQWAITYKPDHITHNHYYFSHAVEFGGQIYVSSNFDQESCISHCAYLNTLSPADGSISSLINIPDIPGVSLNSIASFEVLDNQTLLLAGDAIPTDVNRQNYTGQEGGAYIQTLDANLNQVMTWENSREEETFSVTHTTRLSNGKFVVTGLPWYGGRGTMISVVNSDGLSHTGYQESLQFSSGVFQKKSQDEISSIYIDMLGSDDSKRLIALDTNSMSTTRLVQLDNADITHLWNEDGTITLVSAPLQNGKYDIVVTKRKL